MALKTDFKDDIFEGNRKYKLSQDSMISGQRRLSFHLGRKMLGNRR